MKKITIQLMDVEKDGLPEPNDNKVYFVITEFGLGHGTYGESMNIDEHGWHWTGKYKWHLDFDANGNDVLAYFEATDEFFK